MWLSSFTEWMINAFCTFIVLCVMIALFFKEDKEDVVERVMVPRENVGGRRRRINNLLRLEPESVEYEDEYIEAVVTKPEPEPEPTTDSQIIEDTISALRSVGFSKRDSKAAVLKACEGRVFNDCESLIVAALERAK